MKDNKLIAKLQEENMQLAAKNIMLEKALQQKENLLQHTISEKDAEIDRWKHLYLALAICTALSSIRTVPSSEW